MFSTISGTTMADDTRAAEDILKCDTALEAKRLGYRINGFNMQKWSTEGCDICHEGIKSKFVQNPLLLQVVDGCHPSSWTLETTYKL